MQTGAEVAVFITRKIDAEVLIVHRSPEHGGCWHVIAGGVDPGETVVHAAERELQEETSLVVEVTVGFVVTEYVDVQTKEPAARTSISDPAAAEVAVTCFHVKAPDDWEPKLNWEHDRHRWCDPEEALDSLRWPGTAQALRTLLPAKPGDAAPPRP